MPGTGIEPFRECPVELRRAFEDEFAHLAFRLGIGHAQVPTAAAPLYTLVDLKASWVREDMRV